MSYDPYPLLRRVLKVHTSKEMLGVDLDDPKVWDRPKVVDPDYYLVVHWGGGPNIAGWPVEEPGLTAMQKLLLLLGRCKTVLRGWLAWHTRIVNGQQVMSTIAYSTAVDSQRGSLIRLRGHRHNGGQWGSQNRISHALVLIMGFGQTATRRAWQTVGLVWFCGGGPRVVGHRFFNTWPESKTTTSCPGDENSRLIAEEKYVRALGTLTYGSPVSVGRRVRAVSLKLGSLGYACPRRRLYRGDVARAVADFKAQNGIVEGRPGRVGFHTWKALAAA